MHHQPRSQSALNLPANGSTTYDPGHATATGTLSASLFAAESHIVSTLIQELQTTCTLPTSSRDRTTRNSPRSRSEALYHWARCARSTSSNAYKQPLQPPHHNGVHANRRHHPRQSHAALHMTCDHSSPRLWTLLPASQPSMPLE